MIDPINRCVRSDVRKHFGANLDDYAFAPFDLFQRVPNVGIL